MQKENNKDIKQQEINNYFKFTPEERCCMIYNSSKKFNDFLLKTINQIINECDKLPKNIYLKYILYKIYINYDYNIEIFNVFILEIMQILTTCFKISVNNNYYKIFLLDHTNFNYYLNDINNIYKNNNQYVGIIIDLICSCILFDSTQNITIEVYFMNNILHKYFSFNKDNINLMHHYYTKQHNRYSKYDFIEYDKQYNFFDIYKYFTIEYDKETYRLIKLYEQCSNIRLIWITSCIRYIIYNM